MLPTPNLLWLRAFEASARLESFTAAASELKLTQAAISHQVRSLESTLSVQLFHRRSRHLELTEIGRAYYPSVAKSLESLAYATRGLFGPSTRQALTIIAPITTASYWLAPRLEHYRQNHSDLQIRLLSALWADTARDEHVDVDIRLGNGVFPGYSATKLSDEVMVPVCATEMATGLRSTKHLENQNLIHIHGYQDHWAALFKSLGMSFPEHSGAFSVDNSVAAIEMVSAGLGVALIMKRFAVPLCRSGRLAMPLDVELPVEQSHYLVAPQQTGPDSAVVLEAKAWLMSTFEEQY